MQRRQTQLTPSEPCLPNTERIVRELELLIWPMADDQQGWECTWTSNTLMLLTELSFKKAFFVLLCLTPSFLCPAHCTFSTFSHPNTSHIYLLLEVGGTSRQSFDGDGHINRDHVKPPPKRLQVHHHLNLYHHHHHQYNTHLK